MKLTYCSFVSQATGGLWNALLNPKAGLQPRVEDRCTIVILEGHHEQLAACNLCLEQKLIGGDGQFLSWLVPDEFEELYGQHVGRSIPGDEARVLFDAKSLGEWDKEPPT